MNYHKNQIETAIETTGESFVNVRFHPSKPINLGKPLCSLLCYALEQLDVKQGEPRSYARQAIITKFLPPTEHKGARHKAYNASKSTSVTLDYHNHSDREAAQVLADKLGWGTVVVGTAIDDAGTIAWICQ